MNGIRSIVLTGASAGIGAALMRALAADGHRLCVCARRLPDVGALHHGLFAVSCDVTDEDQVKAFVSIAVARLGAIDVVINCAGLYGAIGRFEDTDSAQWRHAFDVNVFGTYLVSKHALPHLALATSPRIINFAGGGAFNPLPRYSAYATAKAGLVRLTETMAAELADRGIAVNAVAPGFVATEIHQSTLKAGPGPSGKEFYEMTVRRLKDGSVPIEAPIAMVRYLISPQADGLTGKTLSVTFDPWRAPEFSGMIPDLNASPLYTLRRMNIENLPADRTAKALSAIGRDDGV